MLCGFWFGCFPSLPISFLPWGFLSALSLSLNKVVDDKGLTRKIRRGRAIGKRNPEAQKQEMESNLKTALLAEGSPSTHKTLG